MVVKYKIMSYSVLKKMSAFYNDVVDYKLTLNNYDYNINSLIGLLVNFVEYGREKF